MADVSIIVPVYGVERFIRASVESMLSQTHGDIEILLVDDGSPDGCGAICEAFARRDSRVRVLHQRHAGTGMARNAGMDAAQGEYLLFFDPDDWMHPGLVKDALAAARAHRADIVVFGLMIQRLDPSGEPIGAPTVDLPKIAGCFDRTQFFENLPLHKACMPTLGCRLFRTAFLRRYHLRAGPYTTGQDAVFLYDVLSAPFERMVCVREARYTYVIHGGSATQRYQPDRLQNEYRIAQHFENLVMQAPAPYGDGRYDALIDSQYLMSAKRALHNLALCAEMKPSQLAQICRAYMARPELVRALRRQKLASQPGVRAAASALLLRMKAYRLYLWLLRRQGRKRQGRRGEGKP